MPDERFLTDDLPDATWGICQRHNPVGTVRLVDDQGNFAANGVCQLCREESLEDGFFACPVHGIQPKLANASGCPVLDEHGNPCMGAGAGPTEDEIARAAESLNRLWPGGAPAQQDALVPPPAGPEIVGLGEASESAPSEAREVSGDDSQGIETGSAEWTDPFLMGDV